MTLDRLNKNDKVKVLNILGGIGVRNHLNRLGIHIGDTLKIIQSAPFRGPLIVEVHGTEVALGRGVALKIEVERI